MIGLLMGHVVLALVSTSSQPSETKDMVYSIRLSKSSYVLYEPMVLECRVENRSSKDIVTSVLQEMTTPSLQIFITDSSGKTVEYTTGRLGLITHMPVPLRPGVPRVVSKDLRWNAGADDWAFPRAGKYRVFSRVYSEEQNGYLDSERITVRVAEPSGVDAEVIASFESVARFRELMRNGAYGYCRDKAAGPCFDEVRTFLERFESSSFAPFVTWIVASDLDSGLIKVPGRQALAIALLRKFVDRWPTHPYGVRVMSHLIYLLQDTGQAGEVAKMLQEFEKRYPEKRDELTRLRASVHSQ